MIEAWRQHYDTRRSCSALDTACQPETATTPSWPSGPAAL